MSKEDLLKKYFKQILSEQEEEELNLLLESDSDFKTLFDEYSDFNLAFKSHEADQLKDFLKSIDNKAKNKKVVWYKKSVLYYLAAAILIIALCIPFLVKPSAKSLYNDYFDTFPNVEQPVVRGEQVSKITTAFRAYEANNFPIAIDAFRNLLKEDNNQNYKFYYAMSLMNDDKLNLAMTELLELENLDFSYKDETLWYTSLILIKKEQTAQAISKLDRLDKSGSLFKSKERKVLLQKLKED